MAADSRYVIGHVAHSFGVGHRRATKLLDQQCHAMEGYQAASGGLRPARQGGAMAERASLRLRCAAVPTEKRLQQRRNRTMKELRLRQMQKRRRQRIFFGGVGGALVIIVAVVLATVLTSSTPKAAPKPKPKTTPTSTSVAAPAAKVACPKVNGTSPRKIHFASPPPMCISTAKSYTAHMVTDAGTITIELLPKLNPTTVNNFVFLAGYHFYDGTIFHRVVTGFVDQGGDPTGTGSGGPGYSFDGGAPKSSSVYTAGALAMANSGSPSSDGSQFFIVVGSGGKQLSPNYSYFGKVVGGMNVVNKINADGSASEAGTPKVVHKIVKLTVSES